MTLTHRLTLIYSGFALLSAALVQAPVAHWIGQGPLEQSSRVTKCVANANQNKVCTGDHVMDNFGNLGEVQAVVSARQVRILYPIGYIEIVDYASLSPSVGLERCYDNGKGDAICTDDLVMDEDGREGLVRELFNNQRAIVEVSSWNRFISLVEDLKSRVLVLATSADTLSKSAEKSPSSPKSGS